MLLKVYGGLLNNYDCSIHKVHVVLKKGTKLEVEPPDIDVRQNPSEPLRYIGTLVVSYLVLFLKKMVDALDFS